MTMQSAPKRAWPDTLEAAKEAEVTAQLADFWRTLGELPALLQRHEFLLAAELIQSLRGIVIHLMLALNGIRRPAATRNLNTYLSANQRIALERTLGAPNAAGESWVAQATALLVIYRWYAPQLCARFKLAYPQALEDEIWQALRTGIYDWPASVTSDPNSPLKDGLGGGPRVDDHPAPRD